MTAVRWIESLAVVLVAAAYGWSGSRRRAPRCLRMAALLFRWYWRCAHRPPAGNSEAEMRIRPM